MTPRRFAPVAVSIAAAALVVGAATAASDEGARTIAPADVAPALPSPPRAVPPLEEFETPAADDWLLGIPFRLIPPSPIPPAPRYPRGEAVDRHVAGRRLLLTFDDGPFPETTPVLLDVLRRENAPAVFFILGYKVSEKPNHGEGRRVLRRIVEEGHVVGNHSMNHPHLDALAESRWRHEIISAHEAIRSAAGYAPTLFRPPYGRSNAAIDRYVTYRGYTKVMWGYTGDEFEGLPARAVARGMMEQIRERERGGLRLGGVMLLHDGHSISVDAVDLLIHRIKTENCSLLASGERDIWRFVDFAPFFKPVNGPEVASGGVEATDSEIAAARDWCEDHESELDDIRAIDEPDEEEEGVSEAAP